MGRWRRQAPRERRSTARKWRIRRQRHRPCPDRAGVVCHFLVAPRARHEVIVPRSGIEGNHSEGEDERDGALDEGPDDPFRAEVEHLAEEIEDHADEESDEQEEKPPPRVLFRRCVLAGRIGGGRNTLRGLVGIG